MISVSILSILVLCTFVVCTYYLQLLFFTYSESSGKYTEVVQKFKDGQYAYVLKEDFANKLFSEHSPDVIKTLDALLQKNVTDLFQSATEDELEERYGKLVRPYYYKNF